VARIRVGGITASTPATPPRIRIGGITASGAVPATAGRIRIGGITASGPAAVVLNPLEDRVVEPLSPQTITATLAPSSATPTSWSWRRISGATVSIVGTGPTITIEAPGHIDGTFVELGVKASLGGVDSAEQRIRIDTLPALRLLATSAGWVPEPPMVAL
jgi:hypothetical protein